MNKIVIMQPYFIPWAGFFEQIKFADIYVFYDDVQFMKRSLMKKVSIKTPDGSKWLTVPVRKAQKKQLINQTFLDESQGWRRKHLELLKQNYKDADFYREMIRLAEEIYLLGTDNLAEFSINAITRICEYLRFNKNTEFASSSGLDINGSGSQRLISIARHFGATHYLTGMGALNYLDFELFANNNLSVEFFRYAKTEYPQLYGPFDPYVTILDLIANTGIRCPEYLNTTTEDWKTFINSNEAIEYLKKI